MEEQEVVSGENKALRSLNADVETHVNFINQSKQSARAWWLDYSGHPVSYGDIRTDGLLRMDTFLTHPWVFRASRNGAKLLANQQDVYMPTAATEYEEDVYSLQECCLMLIRNLVEEEDYGRLDIPESLKTDLRQRPDLLKELGLINRLRIGVLT
ncbi:von Hippel-Lindau disease tumor suppressor isoform X2 [Oncorhynchus mykiss]|uniref:von Hippel-Lindau disease tumor suppressor isoform X2 n=1 Tax=Oncorhynchus mykiss TaxID=8022 RepID=UPI000B4ED585|nr:von Hippel-Lindau disease tumor suppressor isoform X2 [Oncorhynchus mykiss]